MHLALIKCAASLHFVISHIKSAVQLQMPSFLRLQSIACLLHSVLYSAFSFPKLPLTKAALPGLENDGGCCTAIKNTALVYVCAILCLQYMCMWNPHESPCCYQIAEAMCNRLI